MKERRKLDRFSLRLLGSVEIVGRNKKGHSVVTKNISSGGAFFESTTPLPQNTRVKINLIVPTGVQITVGGSVLRSERVGMAIRFDEKYKIIPISEK
jgi:hypothetical protein